MWPLKSPVSAVARAPIDVNVHCETVFLSNEKHVHLMGQHFPVHLLKVNLTTWREVTPNYSLK
jgi:hypothetical protein